ncbi:MAG: hypothetical protein EOS63_13855 [Mesorhizobium sp.]|nr:MAG: hypothetical protein EOS63_13855 [Mesorhizobium sp.]
MSAPASRSSASTTGRSRRPPERLKYASGLFNTMRNLGGAVGIAICGAILSFNDGGLQLGRGKSLVHLLRASSWPQFSISARPGPSLLKR